MTQKVPLIPIPAIRKPPEAWPMIEPISQVAELMAAAEGNISFATTCDNMAEKVGPENARIAPVIAITEKISNAIVHALKVDDAYVLERNIKSDIQAM